MMRIHSSMALAIGASLALAAGPAAAQDYPWKPDQADHDHRALGRRRRHRPGDPAHRRGDRGRAQAACRRRQPAGRLGRHRQEERLGGERDGYTWTAGAPKQLGTYKLLGQWDTWIDDWQLYNTVTNVPLVSVNPTRPTRRWPTSSPR
jgi:hypothetical protein